MSLDVVVIQHAEEIPVPGDHGITEAGREQARAVGFYLHGYGPFDECWTSPLMRARRTARLVSGEVDLRDPTLHEDARLSERLNWSSEQACARDAFRAEWLRTTRDRDYVPLHGDSSRAAGNRFAAFLQETARRLVNGRVLVVSHGGVTLDLVRTWFGDDTADARAPGAIDHGVPPCALTWMSLAPDARTLHCLAAKRLPAGLLHPVN